jgi:TRAP-type C4-dicarboxylate transport system permease small subunit
MAWRMTVTHALRRVCHVLSGLALAAMLCVTLYEVIGRKLFGISFVGIVDVISFCVMWTTMLGIALAWSQRAHIVVDLLDMTGSPIVIAFLDILTRIVGIVVMPLLVWLAWYEFRDVMSFGDTTPEIGIPVSWFWAAVIVGYGLSTIFLLIDSPRSASSKNV